MEARRFAESVLRAFALEVFARLGVLGETADLAVRSMLDASLMAIDSHGIEALDMYVTHLQRGGLKANAEPIRTGGSPGVGLWDMQHGFGLAGARKIMAYAVEQARESGIYLATCRNANHLGACGVYGKMAADEGLIGIVSQQTLASLAPWGGREVRVGASPFALVAPVYGAFPFYFDASMAAVTRYQIKTHRRSGRPLPEGVATDADGNPTQDPQKAWYGQIMPIGGHKGVGLAMVFEILSCILSGNRFSRDVASIVNSPEESAGSSAFMIAIDPQAVMPFEDFARSMKRYVDYIESSPARDAANPPRYPGRLEGATWLDRQRHGIPVSAEALERFRHIAELLSVEFRLS